MLLALEEDCMDGIWLLLGVLFFLGSWGLVEVLGHLQTED
jgi:hypothetical protein